MIATRTVLSGFILASASMALAQAPSAGTATAPLPPQGANTQPAQAAAVPTLGRLFFTPAERAQLDDMRRRPAAAPVQEKAPPEPGPEYVTLNGVVRRSDGSTTVWLNNKPVQGQRSSEGLLVSPATRATAPGNVTVLVPQSGRRVDLKVGQQLEVTSGRVQEPYRVPPPATTSGEAKPTADAVAERSGSRRPSRDRELLRELLREIDVPAAATERSDSAAPAAPATQR